MTTDVSANIDEHNEPRPDVVVVRAERAEHSPVPVADVLLAVEVISPTSALRDTELKRALHARAGVGSYWIVAPGDDGIALAELVLDGGAYRYATHFTTAGFRTDRPWPVEVDLPALSARRERVLRRARPASPPAGSPSSR